MSIYIYMYKHVYISVINIHIKSEVTEVAVFKAWQKTMTHWLRGKRWSQLWRYMRERDRFRWHNEWWCNYWRYCLLLLCWSTLYCLSAPIFRWPACSFLNQFFRNISFKQPSCSSSSETVVCFSINSYLIEHTLKHGGKCVSTNRLDRKPHSTRD